MGLNEDLKNYLDKIYSEVFPKYSCLKDNELGRKIYKVENDFRRKQASEHFIAGYLAAFKNGNKSPVSYHTVYSDETILKIKGK